jgi:hypothetical protein
MRQVSKRQLARTWRAEGCAPTFPPLNLEAHAHLKCLKRTWGAALARFQGCGTGGGAQVEA